MKPLKYILLPGSNISGLAEFRSRFCPLTAASGHQGNVAFGNTFLLLFLGGASLAGSGIKGLSSQIILLGIDRIPEPFFRIL